MSIALGALGLLCVYLGSKLKDEDGPVSNGFILVGLILVVVGGVLASTELEKEGTVCSPTGAPQMTQCVHP